MNYYILLKSLRLKATLLFALICTVSAGNVWADPVTIYSENFGSPSSNTNISSYTGWSASATMFNLTGTETVSSCYSGNKVGTGDASTTSNYSAASGSGNAFQQGTANTTTTILTVQKINIYGKSSLTLNFAIRNGGAAQYVKAYYQIDNGNENELTLSGYGSTTGWHYVSSSISGTGTNLKLIFKQTPTKGWTTRIDDILLTGTVSGGGSAPSFTASDVNIAYSATGGSIAYTVNNGVNGGAVSAAVKTGDWLTLGQGTTSPISFTCSANSNTSSRTATVTLTYTYNTNQTVTKDVTITQATAPQPSISADNVNIAYDATNGSIGYTLNNGTGNVSASVTSGDWLTLGTITESAVPFTCSANTSTTATRTAQVTLSYTGADNKVVTVTQAKRPNSISEITALNTSYSVIGTVVATNSRGFVIGDGTGYVYTYLNGTPSQSVNDKVSITGSTSSYGQILQFTSSATIATATTSNYNNAPAVVVLDATAMAAYNDSEVYKLSNYVQFEGALATTSTGNNTYYEITVGTGNTAQTARISYPTSAQISALSALLNKTVRVKGYFAGFSSSTFTVMMESVEEVTNPTISVASSSLTVPNYVVGTAEPTYETLTVNGSNLTADITLTLGDNSNFEMSEDLDTWTNTLSLTQSDGSVTNAEVAVRLKAGLSKGSYDGTLTLSSTGTTNKTVSLSGSVTGQTYEIAQYTLPATAHGTITFSPESPVEDGTEVTLTAEAAAGYDFVTDSWVFYKESGNEIVEDKSIAVIDGKITMPAYDLYVDATFTAKPTYAITCVANPAAGGTIVADENAYEGKSVTIECEANSGYALSSIVITKTSDGSATDITPTASGEDYTFTMPGYAVTVTATFEQCVIWDLSTDQTATATTTEMTWTSSYATMGVAKSGASTNTNNYYPGTANQNYKSTRFYKDSELTIAPVSGYAISSVVFTATTNGYAKALKGSSWTNASASMEDGDEVTIVTVTPTYGHQDIVATIGGTCGFTEVKVYYEEYAEPDSAPVWSLPNDEEATVGTEYTFTPATYVTGHPTPSISIESSSADPLLYSFAEGTLHFTPNVAGSVTFTFTATNTVESVDGTLTITVNAASSVSVPVLSVDEANVSSNTAMVSWSSCTGVSSYTLQLASDNEFSYGTADPETIIENAASSVTAPTGWTYEIGNTSGSYLILYQDDYIISKAFNTSAFASLTLTFEMRTYGGTSGDSNKVTVQYSTDNGSSWSSSLGTIAASTNSMVSKELDISGAKGKSSVYIRILSSSTETSKGVGIQNIVVKGTKPAEGGSIISETSVSGNSFTFKELSEGTTYYARVKGAETWSNIVTFTTDAATPSTKTITIASGAKYNGRYWTTFYDGTNGYKLPAGAQAFKLDDNKLVLLGENGVVIPKETPVVIVSDKASLTLTQTNATVTVGDNDLEGSDEAVTVTDGKVDGKIPHVLSIKGSPAVIGFYKFTGSEIPAGKAYVLVSE